MAKFLDYEVTMVSDKVGIFRGPDPNVITVGKFYTKSTGEFWMAKGIQLDEVTASELAVALEEVLGE